MKNKKIKKTEMLNDKQKMMNEKQKMEGKRLKNWLSYATLRKKGKREN